MRKRLVNLAIALPLMLLAADTTTVEPKDLAAQFRAGGIKPRFSEIRFTNAKPLMLPTNFATDWVDKGYPVASEEAAGE